MVSTGLAMLELKIQGVELYPTLLWNEEEAILIDTGMPGQFDQIRLEMEKQGVSFDKLKTIIITHQDLDHIGSLPDILKKSPHEIKVYAHKLDQPFIEGEAHLLKSDPARMSTSEWASLPEFLRFIYTNPPKAKVTHSLDDGQELPIFGGIKIIHTPGHTPGHISLYLKESKALIMGDAMIISNGILRGPVEQTTLDMEMAKASLKKLLGLDVANVICYHGGLFKIEDKNQLDEVIVKL